VLTTLALLMAILALASYATVNFEKMKFLNPVPATISVSGEGEIFWRCQMLASFLFR
jgi:hypothetical protein